MSREAFEAALSMREAAARACIDVVTQDFPTGGVVENVVALVCKRAMERILALPLPGEEFPVGVSEPG